MWKHLSALAGAAAVGLPLAAGAAMERTPAPEGARVYIIAPNAGERVTNPVTVRFGADNVGVAPSGVAHEATGHHHLLIDTELPDLDQPIPSDDRHVHFGGGQTETTIELDPGRHTLRLLMGDAKHVPHQPPIASEPVTITVVE
jgi:hypothetical protein